jgi:hypothetical protein
VRFTGHQRAHILRIRLDAPPEAVWRDGLRLEPEREYRFMADTMHLWVRSGRGLGTTYRIATAADG